MSTLELGMNGAQVVDAVNNAVSNINSTVAGKANMTHTHASYAPVSHTHPQSQVTGLSDTFAPKTHTHTVSEITDIADLLIDLTGSAMTFDVYGIAGEQNMLSIANIQFSGGATGGSHPAIITLEYAVTWNFGGTPTIVMNGKSTSSQMQFAKPVRTWTGWTAGKTNVQIYLTAYNPVNKTSTSASINVPNVERSEYYKISLDDLVSELKKNPGTPGSFIDLLKVQIQEDLV